MTAGNFLYKYKHQFKVDLLENQKLGKACNLYIKEES